MKFLMNAKFWLILALVFLITAPVLAHLSNAHVIHWKPEMETPMRMILHGGAMISVIIGLVILFLPKK